MSSKDKTKMDGEAVGEPICGICLTKSPHAIPGELDGCAHRFCFVCIMTWALDESRCPFCDAPFRAVRRPPVPGLFLSEHIVPVLDRDQEHGSVHADPYADTTCSVCDSPDDGDLLLLCDLCDSAAAAHTYCVGLGDTVPEGDWFCSECAETREEHFRILQLEKHRWLGQHQLEHELDTSIDALSAERAALAARRSVRRTEYEGGRTSILYHSKGLHAGDLPRKLWEVLQVLGYKKAPVYTALKTPLGDDLEKWKVEVRIYEPDQEDGAHKVSKTHRARAQRSSFVAGIREAARRALLAICDEHREALKTTQYCYYFRQPKTGSSDDVRAAFTAREEIAAGVELADLVFMLAEELDAVQHELEDADDRIAQAKMRTRILKAQIERNRVLKAQMEADTTHTLQHQIQRLNLAMLKTRWDANANAARAMPMPTLLTQHQPASSATTDSRFCEAWLIVIITVFLKPQCYLDHSLFGGNNL